MIKVYRFATLVLCLLLAGPAFANEGKTSVLRICDDAAEYPPYIVRNAENHQLVAGATYDLFELLFARAGIEYQVALLPWRRCLVSVEKFSGRKGFEAFANASYSEERANKYWVSDPLYSISNAYWFDTNRFNDSPLEGLSNLDDYSFCSMRGYNVDWLTAINPNINFVEMDSYQTGFRMLSGRRCDLLIGAIPVVRGLEQKNGLPFLNSAKPIIFPDTLTNTYHLYVSRNSPRAKDIIRRFNKALSELKAEHKVEKIYRRYLPECGTTC